MMGTGAQHTLEAAPDCLPAHSPKAGASMAALDHLRVLHTSMVTNKVLTEPADRVGFLRVHFARLAVATS